MSYQSKEELVAIFAQAWRTLNPELIVANLDQSFIYDSQWGFESLDYSRYIDYIRGKFHTIKRSNAGVKVEIVPDSYQGGSMLAMIGNTLKIDLIGKIMNLFFLEGKTKNSRHILIESSLCKRISLNS